MRARLCEPFGEGFQQQGAEIGGGEGASSWCATFDLLLIARWWLAMRDARSPFLAPVRQEGARHIRDKRLRPLVANKRRLFDAAQAQRRRMSSGMHDTRASRAAAAAFEEEFLGLLDSIRPGPTPAEPSPRCRVGAVVGSGHDLRCGAPRGREIDAADLVFRANSAQHGGLANNWLGHSLRRFRIDSRRAGRRTTHRFNCLFAGEYNARDGSHCVVSRTWFELPWGEESANNAQYTCCSPPVRSSYNLSRLQKLRREQSNSAGGGAAQGRGEGGAPSLLWFAGSYAR